MKNILIALTIVTTLALAPRPAHALGDKEAAILGGVLGGVIIGAVIDNALDHDHHYEDVRYRGDRHGDRRDRHGRSYGRGHGPDCSCHSCRPASRSHYGKHDRGGHWTYRTVKVWVPKRVFYSYDDCGRRIRHHQRGHWTYQKEKVWVSTRGRW